MKKLLILTLLISTGFIFCKKANTQNASATKKLATEELSGWFDKFNYDPTIKEFMDSIKKEYPRMLKDIALIKSGSFKGLNIDFVGIIHFGTGFDEGEVLESIKRSQNSIKKLIEAKKYDYIGSENFSTQGPIDYQKFFDEQQYNITQTVRIVYGVKVGPPISQTEEIVKSLAKEDVIIEMITTGVQKPVIIGTEPRWVWLLEQLIRITDLNSLPVSESIEIQKLVPVLSKTRSEIAFARTAKYLFKNGKGKRAVIIYGSNHLKHFEYLRDIAQTNGSLFNCK